MKSVAVAIFGLHLFVGLYGKKTRDVDEYQDEVENWLSRVDSDLLRFNAISAKLTWDFTVGIIDEKSESQANDVIQARNSWKNRVCESKIEVTKLTAEQRRKLYLICRGPTFTKETARLEIEVLNEMKSCYQLKICFETHIPTPLEDLAHPGQNTTGYPKPGDCVLGEPDLEDLMKREDLNSDQLKWIWNTWYDAVGSAMRKVYPKVVRTQNYVARANGYSDMGAVWRDELEIAKLDKLVVQLYKQIQPLYQMLHAVVRHKLFLKHGPLHINATGAIPIHLLGNMWGQNWSPLIELIVPTDEKVDLDESLKKKKWNVHDMVLSAEDFYMSLGLPGMNEKFWKHSIFEQGDNVSMCHGTAANLFTGDDFRMLLCAKVNMEDFYVIHHEMGHLEYNMAYRYQPAVFQEGTNSAFHETIGDVIMHGVMSSQHLYRLGLLSDEDLIDHTTDRYLLLRQALAKIAEIPFSLIIDKYRWEIFEGTIKEENYNKIYWKLNEKIRGIVPPESRSEDYFDAGAKFHVPDNTPYIRYFLSSILQMQVFKGLCELSLFGKHRDGGAIGEDSLSIPLHKCDIYGCKKCGKKLQEAMSLGASVHWSKVLEILTGRTELSTGPLLEYYAPVYKWLKAYVQRHNIPVGW